MIKKLFQLGMSFVAAGLLLSGCNSGDKQSTPDAGSGSANGAKLTGKIDIDGSGTVYPIAAAIVSEFSKANPDLKITVNKAGTGSGLEKFARGEIDIADASRPIEQKEIDALKKANIEFVEVAIAFDGLSVIVNKDNSWVDKLTVDELKKAWAPNSTVKTWADIRPTWPKEKITFYGPTSNHGTFEYFTEAVVGKKNAQRTDYQPNQEYNALVQGVSTEKGSLGYVGFSFYEQNKDKLKLVPVDPGTGPVSPSVETIADGSYKPLSRALFMYVSKKALDSNPAVKAFLKYVLSKDGREIISSPEVGYVQLPDDAYATIEKDVDNGTVGTRFKDVAPGTKLSDVLSKAPVK